MIDVYSSISNKIYPSWAVKAVDNLLLKVKKQGLWGTLDFVIDIWLKKNPETAKKFISERKSISSSRRTNTASSKTKSLRYLVEIPYEISYVIDFFFQREVKEMGTKRFWREFSRRYPLFKVPEKI